MRQWQYLRDGELGGPVDEAELERLLREGRMAPDTMVWSEGSPRWLTVTDVLRPESQSMVSRRGSYSRPALAACAAAMAAAMAVPLTLPIGIVGLLLSIRGLREIDASRATLQPLRGRPFAMAAAWLSGVEVAVFGALLVRLA